LENRQIRFHARSGFHEEAGGHKGSLKGGVTLQMDKAPREDPATHFSGDVEAFQMHRLQAGQGDPPVDGEVAATDFSQDFGVGPEVHGILGIDTA